MNERIIATLTYLVVGLLCVTCCGQDEKMLARRHAKVASLVPEDSERFSEMIHDQMVEFIARQPVPELLQTLEWSPASEPFRKELRYCKSGLHLVAGSLFDLALWKGRSKKLIREETTNGFPEPLHELEFIQSNFLSCRFQWDYLGNLHDIGRDEQSAFGGDRNRPLGGMISRNGRTVAWHAIGENNQPEIRFADTTSNELDPQAIADKHNQCMLLGLSADGSFMVTISNENNVFRVQRWNCQNAKLICDRELNTLLGKSLDNTEDWMFPPSKYSHSSFLIDPEGRKLIVAGPAWLDLETGESFEFDLEFRSAFKKAGRYDLLGLSFSHSGQQLILVTDTAVCVWDFVEGKTIKQLARANDRPVVDIKVSPDGCKLAVLTLANEIPFELPQAGLNGGSKIPDIYLGMGDGLEIWDLTSGLPTSSIPIDKREICTGFEFSPDGKEIAVACYEERRVSPLEPKSTIKIWRLPK